MENNEKLSWPVCFKIEIEKEIQFCKLSWKFGIARKSCDPLNFCVSILCKGQLTDCAGEGEKKLWSRRAREFFSTIPSACCIITTDNEIILLEATNGVVSLC